MKLNKIYKQSINGMRNRFNRMGFTLLGAVCLASTCGITSCSDDYDLPDTKPSFLGGSIYDELKNRTDRTFQTEVKLIDDLGYADVLSKTGSKTLFVADDDAFAKFFETTTWTDGNGNPVRSYEQLSTNQKRLLLNGSMLNNAYVMEMLANTSGGGKNLCLRQETASTATDSVPYWRWNQLPQHIYEPEADESTDSPDRLDFWSYYRQESKGGMYMAVDKTNSLMTHFLEGNMKEKSIKHSDITFLLNLPEGSWAEDGGDRSYVYNRQVVEQDVTCLNGYYHVLDSVLVTPSCMAEVIRTNGKTNLFSLLLERFSAPYYDATLTSEYSALHNINGDSVFQKRYIATNTQDGQVTTDGSGKSIGSFPLLSYDPAWNSYAISSTTTKENDMAAMFVPNDEAMKSYFLTGGGRVLMDRYAKKENTEANLEYNISQIPLEVVQALLNNLMKDSFIETVPSKYLTIMNDAQDQMFSAEIYNTESEYRALFDKVLLANNGVVYVMNTVITPADYAAVTAPALLSKNTKIIRSVLRADEAYIDGSSYNNAPLKQYFSTYLKAMQSRFSFFVPVDEGLGTYGYVDPVSMASNIETNKRYWRFTYVDGSTSGGRLPITATAYRYNEKTGPTTSDNVPSSRPVSRNSDQLSSGWGPTKRELLIEMVNQHTIVHDQDDTEGVNGSRTIYTSRSGAPVIVVSKGDASNNGVGMQIEGGYQAYLNADDYAENDHVATVTEGYDMTRETNDYGNGMTYLIDRPIQPTMQSVYKLISTNDNFSEFFELCNPSKFSEDLLKTCGFADSCYNSKGSIDQTLWSTEMNKYRIFTNTGSYIPAAGEYLVRFFNNYRYTIYVPTNEAVQAALAKGLPTWDDIETWVTNHEDENGLLSDEDKAKAQAMVTCLVNFVRYHFQDDALYVDNVSSNGTYQTSCIEHNDATNTDAYLSLSATQTSGTLSVTDATGNTVHVQAPYNIMARDMNFNANPATITTARYVKNSSYAAIHQINGVLNFSTLTGGRYDSAWTTASGAKKFVRKFRIRK